MSVIPRRLGVTSGFLKEESRLLGEKEVLRRGLTRLPKGCQVLDFNTHHEDVEAEILVMASLDALAATLEPSNCLSSPPAPYRSKSSELELTTLACVP